MLNLEKITTIQKGLTVLASPIETNKNELLSQIIEFILVNKTNTNGIILVSNQLDISNLENISSKHSIVIQTNDIFKVQDKADLILLGDLNSFDMIENALKLSKDTPVITTINANQIATIIPRLLSVLPLGKITTIGIELINSISLYMASQSLTDINGNSLTINETLILSQNQKEQLIEKLAPNENINFYDIKNLMLKFMENDFMAIEAKSLLDLGKISSETFNQLISDLTAKSSLD